MNSGSFFGELKRRNVHKVAAAYIVGGWALAQGIAQVFPLFGVPIGTVRLLVLLIVLGFPISASFSLLLELMPVGIKQTDAADAAIQHSHSNTCIYTISMRAICS